MSHADVHPLVEHFFRHEAGRLLAVLTRFFGWRHADLVEEMVQATLLTALQAWQVRGIPENPSGWIHRVAKNRIVDALRSAVVAERAGRQWVAAQNAKSAAIDDLFLDTQIADSQLRMIFACCHPALARDEQLALTLKTLCGFGNGEIAHALLVSEEAIKKRLQRAKQHLIQERIELEAPGAEQLQARLDGVHQVLYLLFNEGYSASRGQSAVRADMCEEAARLCYLLCSHRECNLPATFALMALMLFHAARLAARLDDGGRVLLMEDQDRRKWDRQLIERAKGFLDRAAEGTLVSPYHLEAGVALLHCSAPSFAETDWAAILRLYDAMVLHFPSPIYRLNRAIVVAHLEGPMAGLQQLLNAADSDSLRAYHLFDATLGELYRRAGDLKLARQHLESARSKTGSAADREIIDRRLRHC